MQPPGSAPSQPPSKEFTAVYYPPRGGARKSVSAPADNPAIVPREDNPLRGWRAVGLWLLPSDLWPREAATNPVLVYFAGRRRRAMAEDFVGILPWAVLAIALVGLYAGGQQYAARPLLSAVLMYAPVLGVILSATTVSWSLRRSLESLPMEELLLTELRAVDIVQGLSVRPLVVQVSGVCLAGMAAIVVTAPVLFAAIGSPSRYTIVSAETAIWDLLLLLPISFLASRIGIEIGGAYAVRANLFLRSGHKAAIRVSLDLIVVILGLLIGMGISTGGRAIAFSVPPLAVPIVVVAYLAISTSALFWLRSAGLAAMDFTHHNYMQWWSLVDRADRRQSGLERGLFTPWRVLPDMSRFWHHKL